MIINKHEAMGVKTMDLINTTVFQIIVIRTVVTHETWTHKKITSYKVIVAFMNKNIILFN